MTDTTTPSIELHQLDIGCLIPHPHNVRRHLGDLTDLAKSIEGSGILEPLGVLPADGDGDYTVVMGHRRLAAAHRAGLTSVPCMIRDLTEAEQLEVMLVENMQRADITPVEEANAYARLIDLDCTAASIAAKVGRSESHVKGRLALCTLPGPVLDLIENQTITLHTAASLVPYAAHEVVMDWVTSNPRHPDMVRQLPIVVWDHAVAGALQAERTKLAKAETAEFTPPTPWWRPKPVVGLLTDAYPVASLGLIAADVRRHKDEPCHAVHLQETGEYPDAATIKVERTPICTSVIRHTPEGPETERSAAQIPGWQTRHDDRPGLTPEQAEADARRIAAREAAGTREKWLATWTQTTVLVTDPLAAQILWDILEDDWSQVAELWDIVDDEAMDACPQGEEWAWLAARSTGPEADRRGHVITALIANYCDRLENNNWRQTDIYPAFLERLAEEGYQLHEVEQDAITKARTPDIPELDIDAMELNIDVETVLMAMHALDAAGDGPSHPASELIEDPDDLDDLKLRGLVDDIVHPDKGPHLFLTDLGAQVAAELARRCEEDEAGTDA